MFSRVIRTYVLRVPTKLRQLSNVASGQIDDKLTTTNNYKVLDTREISVDDAVDYKPSDSSVVEKCQEDISHIAPYLRPSFNLAAYMNKSNTLQQLLKLGVKLYKLEENENVPPYILQLDFDRDMKNYIIFFTDLGLQTEHLGKLIEKNPFIFKEELGDLQVRINYLKYKKFTEPMITRIIQENPNWIMLSTQEIDEKLGHFQKTFSLTGDQVRSLAVKSPRLITFNMEKIKLNTFTLKEEMGFNEDELKQILLDTPNLFLRNQVRVLKAFAYVHKEMNIPLEMIAKMSRILTYRVFKIQQRHQFLEKLGKVQFDPKKPNYISLKTLVSKNDGYFATEVAGSSINAFNAFLKSV